MARLRLGRGEVMRTGDVRTRRTSRRAVKVLVQCAVLCFLLGMAYPIWGAPRSAHVQPPLEVSAPRIWEAASPAATWSEFTPTGWVTTATVTCSVKVVDPVGVQPATAEYRYSTDGGATWSPWTPASTTSPISTTAYLTAPAVSFVESGTLNRVDFRILDTDNVTDTSFPYGVLVDPTPPSNPTVLTSTSHVVGAWSTDNTVDVVWSGASDATSGVAGYSYLWDTSPTTLPDTVQETAGTSTSSPPLADGGSHYFHLRTRDDAGNWATSAAHLGPFRVDTQAPGAPIGLSASPLNWSTTDAFTLTWTNPADTSGIVGAYYRLDAPPASPTDGTFVTTTHTISDIHVGTEGAHLVYVWLKDAAGNVNHANLANTTLYYDGTPPGPPTNVQVSPPGWTNVNGFDLTWIPPADTSGVVGSYHKLDAPPASDTDGTFTAHPSRLDDLAVSGEGEHTLYLWLRDAAGNVSATQRTTATLRYDATPPGPPVGLTVDPSSWTATNAFTLTWTNPADLSGVVGAYYKLGVPPTGPADGAFVTTTNTLANVTVPGTGEHTAYVWLRDAAGNANHTSARTRTLRYDGTPPSNPTVLTSTSHLVGVWSQNPVVEVTWSGASDGESGVHGYSYVWDTLPGTLPDTTVDTTGDGVSSPPLPDGNNHYFHLRTRDVAGNWATSAVHLGPFYIDAAEPGAPVNLTASPSTWTRTNAFTVTWENPGDPSGVSGAYYKLDAPPISPTDGTLVLGENLTQITGIAVSGDGAHSIYVWLRDGAGNADHTKRSVATLYLDTAAPGAPTNLVSVPSGWTNTNAFTLTWTNPVDLSGVVGAYYKLNAEPTFPTDGTWVTTTNVITGIAVPAEGKHDVFVWLKDAAGNVQHANRNVKLQAFWYDITSPTSSALLEGPLGRNGWYTGTVQVTLSGTDNLSGVPEIRHRVDGGPWDTVLTFGVSGDGQRLVEFRALDGAGNLEPTHALTVSIDTVPPTTAVDLAGPLGLMGWYTGPVTVSFTIQDSTSGPDATHYQVDGGAWGYGLSTVVSGDGNHTVLYASEDRAGNREEVDLVTFRIDMTPPTTTYHQEGVAGDNGWFHSDVTVTLTVTDTASGADRTWYRVDSGPWQEGTSFVVRGEGQHLVQFRSSDLAGNLEPVQEGAVGIDVTPPLPPINIQTQPASWTRTNAFTVTWTSLSDVSGIAGAYYKLNAEPVTNTDGTLVLTQGDIITGVAVPGEGLHDLYLWLRDRAGNTDYRTRNIKVRAFALDQTPPTVEHQVLGQMGQGGWYTSPVNILLSTVDTLSGPGTSHYRVDGSQWFTGTFFPITDSGRHQVEFYALDQAGNPSSVVTIEVPVDVTPPSAPLDLEPYPLGWTSTNDFSVSWANPEDLSGITGGCYKLNLPPRGPGDGICVANIKRISGIRVPGQGKHDLYLWLRDGAGNQGTDHAAFFEDAFWYDSLPPTTTHTLTGTLGAEGWFVSPVQVSLTARDDGCGVTQTQYRLNWGLWRTGTTFTVTDEGSNLLEYRSVDCLGQWEPTRQTYVKVDTQPPDATILSPRGYSASPIFTVAWGGQDSGSGIATYDVEYRDGPAGPWTPFRTGTSDTSGLFAGQRGHVYYFRVRARDHAGNQEEFPSGDGDAWVLVDPLANGDFSTGDFSFWTVEGPLTSTVRSIAAPLGGQSLAACLGSPDYGPSYNTEPPGTVPIGAAKIKQAIAVPSADLVSAPTLTLWYHIWTYDVVWSERFQKYYDSFEVLLTDPSGITLTLALQDGNRDPSLVGPGMPVVDLGWRRATVDLRPYAGQTIVVELSNWNRQDHFFNTWTCVDEVRVINVRSVYLPLAGRAYTGGQRLAGEAPEALPPEGPRAR
ncbi:MAG: OmpL47-type beta-barrel domain-containing protein [Anaerolineae bacterium]